MREYHHRRAGIHSAEARSCQEVQWRNAAAAAAEAI